MILNKIHFRGSRDGFNAVTFHKQCDNKDETFIVLSSTNGFLFGGYTDANWTTPQQGSPTYSRSTRAFLFSLVSPQRLPATKLFLDARYYNYATVNDFLSGPIFGNMMRPDLGIFESNGEFRCQINFPSWYRSAVGVPYLPTSDDCVINEIEVFTAVFPSSSSLIFRVLINAFFLIITFLEVFIYFLAVVSYETNTRTMGRFFSICCLILLCINSPYLYSLLTELLFVVILIFSWIPSTRNDGSYETRYEKHLIMSAFVFLLLGIILLQ